MNVEILEIPAISTAHITEEVSDRLSADGGAWCPVAEYIGVGFFVWLDEPHDHSGAKEPVPQCLLDITAWLKKRRRTGLVMLDCDADTVPELPVYGW